VEHWKNKTAHYNDFRLRGAKGEYRQIHCLAVPIFDEEGNFQHFQGFNIDVTEREQVVEALRESEERYRTLFDGVPIGLYRTSPDGRIMDANLALVQMLGYPDRESLQATNAVNTYVNAEGRQSWQALIKQEGMLSNFEKQLRRYDGSNIFLEENARAVYDPEGRVLFYEGSFQDITERKQAEEALRRNEEKMRLILDATTDGIWKWNFMTNELNFSPRYYTMLGYEPDEFPSNFESWQNLIHPDDLQSALGVAEEYLKTKPDKYENEFRLKTKHGGYRWIRARARVVERSQDGNALLMIGNHEDITERKQAEEEKRRLEERSRKVVEDIFRFIPEGVLVFSRKMELLRQNQAFRELVSGYARRLGFAEDELGNLIIDKIKAGLRDNNIDEFVKSRKGLMIVIPAKAGSGSGTGAGIQ
jgi:PAS domain S-box-containing protein